jgi:hypothetical protein
VIPNYTETEIANIAWPSVNGVCTIFDGGATINFNGFGIVVSPLTGGPCIKGQPTFGGDTGGTCTGTSSGVNFIQGSGSNASLIVLGNSSGSNVLEPDIENISFCMQQESAGGVGIDAYGIQQGRFVNNFFIGPNGTNSTIGIRLNNGNNDSEGNYFLGNRSGAVHIGIQNNKNTYNHFAYNIWSLDGSTSAICMDFEGISGHPDAATDINDYCFDGGPGLKCVNCQKVSGTLGSESGLLSQPDVTLDSLSTVNHILLSSLTTQSVTDASNGTSSVCDVNSLFCYTGGVVTVPGCPQQGPASALTGNGLAQTVYTCTMTANVLCPTCGIKIDSCVNHSTGSASVAYILSFGGTNVMDTGISTAGTIEITGTAFNNSSTSSQWLLGNAIDAGTPPGPQSGTASISTSSAVTITLTFNVASTDKVTPCGWSVSMIH